ncbi:MAG: RES family NAD+ phosphorylase, partial [Acetobacteraceae bacterium]|nr:RES family NAD+ phosphorylase [Acetobacteraceae bacterium]
PARRMVSLPEIEARSFALVALRADVRLVDLTGPGLSRLGLDARVLSGGYEVCGAWADALHDHRERPAGILYPSRFDPSERCVALFDRAAPHLDPGTESVPLGERPHDVAAALDRYGKALDPG